MKYFFVCEKEKYENWFPFKINLIEMILFKRIYWQIKCKFVIEPLSYNYNLAWCLIMWFYISVEWIDFTWRNDLFHMNDLWLRKLSKVLGIGSWRMIVKYLEISYVSVTIRVYMDWANIFFCSDRIDIPSIRNWPYPTRNSLRVKTIVSWIDENFVNIRLFIDIAKMYKVISGLRYEIE